MFQLIWSRRVEADIAYEKYRTWYIYIIYGFDTLELCIQGDKKMKWLSTRFYLCYLKIFKVYWKTFNELPKYLFIENEQLLGL